MSRATPGWDWEWARGWSLVYAANLPMALMFGCDATGHGGRLGMALGVGVLWSFGLTICAWPGRLRHALIVGGWAVAASQILFFPHFIIGAIALESWGTITGGGTGWSEPLSELGGFAVTLMTGQPLIILAVVVGWVGCWVLDLWPSAAEESPQADG